MNGRSVGSYLLAFFCFMFWGFRVLVAVQTNLGSVFVVPAIDLTYEVIVLFASFITLLFVIRHNMAGVVVYAGIYSMYFGVHLMKSLAGTVYADPMMMLIDAVAMLLVVLQIFDTLLDKSRKANPRDKKTDWFYKNKAYDRQLDERADKNEYKIM